MDDIDKLVQYMTILNNYQHGNYKLNNDELEVLKVMNKTNDLKTKIQVDKINKMSFSEREKYLDELKNKKQQQNNTSNSLEEQIALTFGVNITDIKVKMLKNGKKLYTFFDDKLGRNVVLQDGGNLSLTSTLEKIRKESSQDAEFEKQDIIEDKRVKEGLEVNFVFLSEIGRHLSEIASFSQEKRMCLKFLLDHASEYGVVAINLENMIGIDSKGNIFEAYLNMYKVPKIDNVDQNFTEQPELKKEEENSQKDSQLAQMLEESNEIEEKQKEEVLDQNSQKLENSTVARVLQRQIPQYENSENINTEAS